MVDAIQKAIMNLWGQLQLLFDPESSSLVQALEPLLKKTSENPLAFLLSLLALVGIPYALYKIKKSSTEAGKRLDKLIEELENYESEKPSFSMKKDSPTESSSEETGPLLWDSLEDKKINTGKSPPEKEEPSAFPDWEKEKASPEALPLAGEKLPHADSSTPEPGSWDTNLTYAGDGNLVEAHEEEEDWESAAPAISSVPEADSSAPQGISSQEIEDLQRNMESTIEQLSNQLAHEDFAVSFTPEEKENPITEEDFTVPPIPVEEGNSSMFEILEADAKEPTVTDAGTKEFPEAAPSREEPLSPPPDEDSPPPTLEQEPKAPVPKSQNPLIQRLETFQKHMENRFRSLESNEEIHPEEKATPEFDPEREGLEPTGVNCPRQSELEDKDYLELLESLVFLRNQTKRK
ncbi:MAG: hypothetical protein ACE5E9_05660 [Nitrospinaceae bacterium]